MASPGRCRGACRHSVDQPSSSLPPSSSPAQQSLCQPSFRKEPEDLDEQWSPRMVWLEALQWVKVLQSQPS